HEIQITLGHKSFLFQTKVRPGRSQKKKTCAWQEVTTVEDTVKRHARVYVACRQAMVLLGA
ncbi:hypothetical protein JAAARDRAFT_86214, partial [Jaapia argillacea MUCL 33604]